MRCRAVGFTAEAIDIMRDVLEKISRAGGERDVASVKRSLRSRARSVPSLIVSSGLPQILAFLASKSDPGYYEYLVKDVRDTQGRAGKGESAGYSAYLYVIMRFLAQQGLGDELGGVPSSIEGVIDAIKKIDEDPNLCSGVQSILLEFLLEFKKIAEALIEESSEG